MSWYVAQSLEVLRKQFNETYPNRSKASDGGIGDAAHASRDSDHNPWLRIASRGVVTARDFTHDPAHGMDIDRLTDELQASRDPRIKYIIANGWIMDTRPGYNPWNWVKYHGSNPHNKHFHISVKPENCNDDSPWDLASFRKNVTPDPVASEDLIVMGLQDTFTDWAGNKQSGESWANHVDKRLYELHQAVLGLQQSRIPGDENRTNAANLWFDAGSWDAQTLGRVTEIEKKLDQLMKHFYEHAKSYQE